MLAAGVFVPSSLAEPVDITIRRLRRLPRFRTSISRSNQPAFRNLINLRNLRMTNGPVLLCRLQLRLR